MKEKRVKYKSYSNILFETPSFISGMAKSLGLFGNFNRYNSSLTEDEADYKGIYSDWLTIGNDIRNTISKIKRG